MDYVDVTSDGAAFHTVRSPLVEPFTWYFDGVGVKAPDAGIDIRIAAGGSYLIAVGQGWTTGQCVVMNNLGAVLIIAPVTTGLCGTAAEYVGDNKFRIAAVVGLVWKSWIVSGDLKSVTFESEQPTLNGSSQGWTDFQNNVPTWADINRVVVINELELGLPMTRGPYTIGQSYVEYGADAYNSVLNRSERVASSNTNKQPRIAALPDGRAMAALSADVPLFVPSSSFSVPWPPSDIIPTPEPPNPEPEPLPPDPPIPNPEPPDVIPVPNPPKPSLKDRIMASATTLLGSNFIPSKTFPERWLYPGVPSNPQLYLSIDCNGVETASPNDGGNEAFIWTKGDEIAEVEPADPLRRRQAVNVNPNA